jgi:hypothetical protein
MELAFPGDVWGYTMRRSLRLLFRVIGMSVREGSKLRETGKGVREAKGFASFRTLAFATLATAGGMLFYEFTKEQLFPSFSKWESYIATICVTSVITMIITASSSGGAGNTRG